MHLFIYHLRIYVEIYLFRFLIVIFFIRQILINDIEKNLFPFNFNKVNIDSNENKVFYIFLKIIQPKILNYLLLLLFE